MTDVGGIGADGMVEFDFFFFSLRNIRNAIITATVIT